MIEAMARTGTWKQPIESDEEFFAEVDYATRLFATMWGLLAGDDSGLQ